MVEKQQRFENLVRRVFKRTLMKKTSKMCIVDGCYKLQTDYLYLEKHAFEKGSSKCRVINTRLN